MQHRFTAHSQTGAAGGGFVGVERWSAAPITYNMLLPPVTGADTGTMLVRNTRWVRKFFGIVKQLLASDQSLAKVTAAGIAPRSTMCSSVSVLPSVLCVWPPLIFCEVSTHDLLKMGTRLELK